MWFKHLAEILTPGELTPRATFHRNSRMCPNCLRTEQTIEFFEVGRSCEALHPFDAIEAIKSSSAGWDYFLAAFAAIRARKFFSC
jgi:hypothetical protein